jgi:hypothetical protein
LNVLAARGEVSAAMIVEALLRVFDVSSLIRVWLR